ncbi:hypothetical protein ACH429_14825 [Streptomyces pathocidini]|uniref:Uncharacterized protein n=1 Tax=Streptomyces pathocidini TaxID=1650571 RepID=A0ABW7UUH4_9ACTN|nr:hypothetical protein [Streptomyces pathocidini]
MPSDQQRHRHGTAAQFAVVRGAAGGDGLPEGVATARHRRAQLGQGEEHDVVRPGEQPPRVQFGTDEKQPAPTVAQRVQPGELARLAQPGQLA